MSVSDADIGKLAEKAGAARVVNMRAYAHMLASAGILAAYMSAESGTSWTASTFFDAVEVAENIGIVLDDEHEDNVDTRYDVEIIDAMLRKMIPKLVETLSEPMSPPPGSASDEAVVPPKANTDVDDEPEKPGVKRRREE